MQSQMDEDLMWEVLINYLAIKHDLCGGAVIGKTCVWLSKEEFNKLREGRSEFSKIPPDNKGGGI